jgi:hypothetical protein
MMAPDDWRAIIETDEEDAACSAACKHDEDNILLKDETMTVLIRANGYPDVPTQCFEVRGEISATYSARKKE